jgi:hypothetical protein
VGLVADAAHQLQEIHGIQVKLVLDQGIAIKLADGRFRDDLA